jgi:hypothetical protein
MSPSVIIVRIYRKADKCSYEEIKPCLTYEDAAEYIFTAVEAHRDQKMPEVPCGYEGWPDDTSYIRSCLYRAEYMQGPSCIWNLYDRVDSSLLQKIAEGNTSKKPIVIYLVRAQGGEKEIDFQVSIK